MDKNELYQTYIELTSLDVLHDNLDRLMLDTYNLSDRYGWDEDLECGILPDDLCEELMAIGHRIQKVSAKVLEIMRQKETELQMGLGFSKEEIEDTNKFVNGIMSTVVKAAMLEEMLKDDEEEEKE